VSGATRAACDVEIREATSAEAHLVLALVRAAFAETARHAHPSSALSETLEDIEAKMRTGGAIVSLLDGRPIGAALFDFDPEARALSYRRLSVHPSARDRGIGTRMVEWLEAHARALGASEVRVEARSQMPDNRPYYLARGYVITGYSERYGIPDIRTHLVKSL
jgi:GNAT superfamily N-acetyltransferase